MEPVLGLLFGMVVGALFSLASIKIWGVIDKRRENKSLFFKKQDCPGYGATFTKEEYDKWQRGIAEPPVRWVIPPLSEEQMKRMEELRYKASTNMFHNPWHIEWTPQQHKDWLAMQTGQITEEHKERLNKLYATGSLHLRKLSAELEGKENHETKHEEGKNDV